MLKLCVSIILFSLCIKMFCYLDHVLSLNNSKFGDFVDRICPIELIKDTTDRASSTSYIDLHLEIKMTV
jgi:hypothetical protein